jgi:hypothetical protein
MKKLLLILLSYLFFYLPAAEARQASALQVRFTLTHITADKWRANYVLAKPVTSIDLGAKVGAYRERSWRMLTPGVKLLDLADRETITRGGKPFSAFSLEVSLFTSYSEGNYTPFDRMSDGGTDVFLGFFAGDGARGGHMRPLHLKLHLAGLAHETVIGPDQRDTDQLSYAYFGPSKPVPAGVAQLILDPKTPDWVALLLQDTTAKITAFYDRAFQRPLRYKPLIMVSISDFESRGLSTKGGAIGKEVVYRLGGKALLGGSPRARAIVTEMIAHELAHVWQNNVSRGGIGGNEPWVHEGGAEAIALAGLRGTGLFTAAEADAYAAKWIQECDALNQSVDSYRGYYACGFKRYSDYQIDVLGLWKAMMERSESTGAFYSSAMIEAIRTHPRWQAIHDLPLPNLQR